MPLKKDSAYADGPFCRTLHSKGNTGEKICINCKFVFIHTYFLKGKIPPGKDSLRTHGYKYMFI